MIMAIVSAAQKAGYCQYWQYPPKLLRVPTVHVQYRAPKYSDIRQYKRTESELLRVYSLAVWALLNDDILPMVLAV